MPIIPVTDRFGLKLDLNLDDASEAVGLGLKTLESKTSAFVEAAGKPVDQAPFQSAVFGGVFISPTISLGAGWMRVAKSGANVGIAVFRAADKSLFGSEEGSLAIPIAANEAWIKVSVDVFIGSDAALTAPSGLGIAGKTMTVRQIAAYVLLTAGAQGFPTLKRGVELALSHLRVPRRASDLRQQSTGTVLEWDISGKFALEGTFQYPLATNVASLASLPLPLGAPPLKVEAGPALSLTGALSITGEFRGRSYRRDQSTAQFGLFKKQGSDFTAGFQAQAGLGVAVNTTDIVGELLTLFGDPSLRAASLPDPDRKAMRDSLNASLDTGFSIGLNAACSAARTNEAAILYEVALTASEPALDRALEAALQGNWTAMAHSGARELRNAVSASRSAKHRVSLNLLGIYNYGSVAEFVRQSTVLHDRITGAITVTDKETAQRLSIASDPLASDDERLRKLLDECFLATVAYAASSTSGISQRPVLSANQQLTLYAARLSGAAVRKILLLGRALRLLSEEDLAAPSAGSQYRYFRLAARAKYSGEVALPLFFSDVAARLSHREVDLVTLGRQVLTSLLDANDPADRRRIEILTSDSAWNAMDRNRHFPPDSPASYSDWYDITFWAHAIATAAPVLALVLAAADNLRGVDPSKNEAFVAARHALSRSLAEVTRDTHAAFEKGWPLAAMFALSGGRASITFDVQWDGNLQFERESPRAMTV